MVLIVNNNGFIKLDLAEFKLAKFLNAIDTDCAELSKHLSYRADMEPCNGNHTIVLKIDIKAVYSSLYEKLCSNIDVSIDKIASVFKFPEYIIIEFRNYSLPYATMYIYRNNGDDLDTKDYYGDDKNNYECAALSIIKDIEKMWSFNYA